MVRWRWVLLVIALLGLGVLGFVLRDPIAKRLPFEKTADLATEQAVVRSIFALGRFDPEGEVIAVAGPSGTGDARIKALEVTIGQRVQTGDVLAVLDNRQRIEAAVQVAASRILQAERQVAQIRVSTASTRQQLVAALEGRSAEAEQSLANLQRQQQLLQSNATSRQEYDNAVLATQTAEKAVGEAKAKLSRYSQEVDQSVDVQLAMAEVDVAKASYAEAQANLEQTTVRAPVPGTILHIESRVGERISTTPLLQMGRTDSMLVRAEVYESDVALIQPNQRVIIRAPALKAALAGRVDTIATLVQRQSIIDSDPAANTDARVVEVFVRLDRDSSQRAAKFVGMQVRVEFPLEPAPEVLP